MRAIHRKLLRDLWRIRTQAVAIALVLGSGVAMFIAYFGTFSSLEGTQQRFYAESRFGDVFASLKRAPDRVASRLEALPGVDGVATRVVIEVNLDLAEEVEPVSARMVSIPDRAAEGLDRTSLNRVTLVQGRHPEPERAEEVIVSEGFALARGLGPGDRLAAVINGRRRQLEIVGVGLSPEYVFAIRPGELIPDRERFAILWMGRRALAAAYDMEGGFNDVSIALAAGAEPEAVIAQVDRVLRTYGGLGAIPRSQQLSNWYLSAELKQLRGFGSIVPTIFLLVAAFLLNVVLTRIVTVQREQIAALKALGYDNREIGLHYTLWSVAIAAIGLAFGLWAGNWLGGGMLGLYNDLYRFPELTFRIPRHVLVLSLVISLVAALIGAVTAVRKAVTLPPAEAMRPEPPAHYRETFVERLGLRHVLSQPARMILRNLERRPLRALASITGIAFSGGLMIIGLFFLDSIDRLMTIHFGLSERQDVTVAFYEPRGAAALHALERMPGVMAVEPARDVAVRLGAGHRSRRASIQGLEAEPLLKRVVDASRQVHTLPPEGLVLSSKMAELLEVEPGDSVRVEVLEGRRPVRDLVVAGLVDELLGTSVYLEVGALRSLLREGGVLSGGYLRVDPSAAETLYLALRRLPLVAGVSLKRAAVESFQRQMDDTMGVFILFNVLFASIITIGVVYNAARVALSERGRELASLRVLGFTRGEISTILLGELAVLVVLAIPLGLLLGTGFARVIVEVFDTELYRFPFHVSVRTYLVSALTVLGAGIVSALAVRRRLDRLDLVEVLKTRE